MILPNSDNALFFIDIDLKVAAKFFGTKFACGSSVTGDDEIVIQGDVKDDLFDIIPEKWPEVCNYINLLPSCALWSHPHYVWSLLSSFGL